MDIHSFLAEKLNTDMAGLILDKAHTMMDADLTKKYDDIRRLRAEIYQRELEACAPYEHSGRFDNERTRLGLYMGEVNWSARSRAHSLLTEWKELNWQTLPNGFEGLLHAYRLTDQALDTLCDIYTQNHKSFIAWLETYLKKDGF